MNKRLEKQMRTRSVEFTTREENDEKHIVGYFSVFGDEYELFPGATESVDPHAFDDVLTDAIRALINHDTTLVLGRTTAGTLKLEVDNHGLRGDILINPDDQDAVNAWARVQRGDVSQCSFGFDILDEETEWREDGSVHWTIKAVKLYEVSVCTFPAYQGTEVSARQAQYADVKKRRLEVWKEKTRERMRAKC